LGVSTSSLNILSKLEISGLEDIHSTESIDIEKPTVNKLNSIFSPNLVRNESQSGVIILAVIFIPLSEINNECGK
jgi:hypothetical protein